MPSGILLEKMPKDALLMEEYLHSLSGRSVNISVPKKGERKALLSLALRDAAEMTKSEELWNKVHAKRVATGVKPPSKIGKDRAHLLHRVFSCTQ